jgi:glycosyltransferase involved in cell wall biosynthesis
MDVGVGTACWFGRCGTVDFATEFYNTPAPHRPWRHGYRQSVGGRGTVCVRKGCATLSDALRSATTTISVICAVRNVRPLIGGFLKAWRQERIAECELVIADGLSSDGTTEILRADGDLIDTLIVERDEGIYDAWNKAVLKARGRYVCFIGADDRIAPGALSVLCAAAREEPEVDLIYGFGVQTAEGIPIRLVGRPFRRDRIQFNLTLAHVMAAHRRQWIIESGMFAKRFKASGDYDFLLRSRLTMTVRQVDAVLAYIEDGGVSRRAWWPFLETRQARLRNGMSRPLADALLLRAVVGRLGRLALGLRI